MNHFKDVSAILSVVLALGITRVLTAFVLVFRSRRKARLDWIPIAWAASIFLWQLQYAWATVELPGLVSTWKVTDFLDLLALVLLLFLSAALVLPSSELAEGEDLRTSFERDGRWALVCLSGYFLWSMAINWHFWHMGPLSPTGALSAALALAPIAFLVSRRRRVQAIITVTYIALSVLGAYVFSPRAY